MRTMIGCGLLAVGMLVSTAGAQDKPEPRKPTVCEKDKGGSYVCSRAAFHHVWRRAQTVQVEVQPRDANAKMQVSEFVTAAGKTVAEPGAPADVVMTLFPADTNAVKIGPAGSDLSVLSVYLVDSEGKRGPLVWSEVFNGQLDMRWPAVVHAALSQFQQEFQKQR